MEWTQERVEALFNSVEENQHIEFKAGEFFKDDFTDSLTKFVTGFANADGGVLLVCVREGNREDKIYAVDFWPFDGLKWNREKIEALIDQHVSPRIPGIRIHPIRLEGDAGRSIYAIEIPKSDTCHQASDNRSYFRLDASTRAMKDFQIRDVMNRRKYSNLRLCVKIKRMNEVTIGIRNDGMVVSKNWSFTLAFPENAIDFVKFGSGNKFDFGSSYEGLRMLSADFESIKSTRASEILERPCHIFEFQRTSLAHSETIFPRTILEIASFKVDYINEEKMMFYTDSVCFV